MVFYFTFLIVAVGIGDLEGETGEHRQEWFGNIKPSGGNTFHANITSVFTFDSFFFMALSGPHTSMKSLIHSLTILFSMKNLLNTDFVKGNP